MSVLQHEGNQPPPVRGITRLQWLIWIAALWAAIFPGLTWSLAVFFQRLAGPQLREVP